MADHAADLLALLERAGPALPAVRALHLPMADPDSKDGEFCAIELEDGSMGLGFVRLDDSLARLSVPGLAQGLQGQDALAVARHFRDGQGAWRTLGFAACNAIAQHLYARIGFVPPAATDSLAGLDPQRGDHIGMVGFFPPLVRQVPPTGARLTVLELRADLAGLHPSGAQVVLDPAALGSCNKILCTSTVLLNGTLDRILEACRGAHQIALIGPGASGLGQPLWDRGVTVLAGTQVSDPAGFAAALRSGAPWSPFARKFILRREDDPGLARLLSPLP
jgi:uncharacterized protein